MDEVGVNEILADEEYIEDSEVEENDEDSAQEND